MKITLTQLLFTALICLSFSSLKSQGEEAYEYMSEISENIDDLKNDTWRYLKSVTRGKSARRVEKKRQNLIEELRDVQSEVSRQGSFKGDDTLRKAVVNYLHITYLVFKEDFGKILDMEDIAERSYDNMEAYMMAKELANEKLDSAFGIYKVAQQKFADKYGITLTEGELDRKSEKIKRASKALKYYNRIFLVFFKTQIQEIHALDALQRNDIISMEQSTNALSTAAQESLNTLDTMRKYRGDAGLIRATREVVEFFKAEAENDYPQMVDFYIKKDNFEKLKEMMDAKKKRDLTEEDINKFNAAVEEYNKMIPQYNELSQSSNEKREEAMERWEEKVEDFFDEHA